MNLISEFGYSESQELPEGFNNEEFHHDLPYEDIKVSYTLLVKTDLNKNLYDYHTDRHRSRVTYGQTEL